MNKKTIFPLIGVGVLIVIGIVAFLFMNKKEVKASEAFAQCLNEKKVVMYGEDSCPVCQKQKKLFGDFFKLVPYVECKQDPQACVAAGVQHLPTWVFPNGDRLEGKLSVEKLSAETGCPSDPND